MRFTLVSLFPEFFDSALGSGLMSKARDAGIVSVDTVNPRDFTEDRHRTVDDRPYGGGPGMVMMLDPLRRSLDSVGAGEPGFRGKVIQLTPRGKPFTQADARRLSSECEHLVLLCGRYEGIDARIEDMYPVENYSVGDFVLNGGESAATCMVEAVARLVPEFMGHEESGDEESFSRGLLEYPHFTRPPEYEGRAVPEVLSSGDHGRVAQWRREQALEMTLRHRPDILSEADLNRDDVLHLRSLPRKRPGRNLFVALVHYPVLNKFREVLAVSLTNLDIHDIARVSRSYGLGGYYVTTPLEDQQKLFGELIGHWTSGAGRRNNPDRAEAMEMVRMLPTVEEAIEDITERTGKRPRLIATSARGAGSLTAGQVRGLLDDDPVLLVMGTASGLAPQVMEMCEGTLRPVRFMDGYNHFSVRTATAIILDRILGDVY